MGGLSWLLLAAAAALAGRGSRTGGRPDRTRHRAASGGADPRFSAGALSVGAGVAAGAIAIVLAGPAIGGVSALVAGPAAAWLTRRLAARPRRAGPVPVLPFALDLTAAALRAGRPVSAALRLGAPALPPNPAGAWLRAASLLELGADPEQAWSVLAEVRGMALVAFAARRSADSGARLARLLAQLATETRAELRAAALARANRAGVAVLAPLGLCFLPAFVCLGIVPTVVGVARSALPGLF